MRPILLALMRLFEVFNAFKVGKATLRNVRSRREIEVGAEEGLIRLNHAAKTEYEEILQRVHTAFRRRLSGAIN